MFRKGFAKASKILHDLHFWGGSHILTPQDTYEERLRASYHCSIVNGRIINMYSFKDTVLKYLVPQMQPGCKPIGSQEILTDAPDDEDGAQGNKKIHNYQYKGDHHAYLLDC